MELKIVKSKKYHVYNIKAHNALFPIKIRHLNEIIISLFSFGSGINDR